MPESCRPESVPAGAEFWRDYFGGQLFADYQVDVGAAPGYAVTVTEQQSYLAGPGLAQQDADGANTRYHHGDLIDSSVLFTDGSAAAVPAVIYSAFGEAVIWTGSAWQVGGELPPGRPRHGYASGSGYESGHYQDPPLGSNLPGFSDFLALYGPNTSLTPVTLQHVGWRWYQSEIGRFVQRDPIGTRGGLNVYAYCDSDPVSGVDPTGTDVWSPWDEAPHRYIIIGPLSDGSYMRIDMGASWEPAIILTPLTGGPGRVAAAPVSRPSEPPIVTTTPQIDDELLRHALSTGWYYHALFYNCIVHAQHTIDCARHLAQPPTPARPPTPTRPQGYWCFAGGTAVDTPAGPIPIEQLAPGDTVSCRGATAIVERKHVAAARALVYLQAGEEAISCTPEHPFWVVGRGWVPAGDLRRGDFLCDAESSSIEIVDAETRTLEDPVPVFNLSVGGDHTYYVGKSRILVHNKMP